MKNLSIFLPKGLHDVAKITKVAKRKRHLFVYPLVTESVVLCIDVKCCHRNPHRCGSVCCVMATIFDPMPSTGRCSDD